MLWQLEQSFSMIARSASSTGAAGAVFAAGAGGAGLVAAPATAAPKTTLAASRALLAALIFTFVPLLRLLQEFGHAHARQRRQLGERSGEGRLVHCRANLHQPDHAHREVRQALVAVESRLGELHQSVLVHGSLEQSSSGRCQLPDALGVVA